MGCQVLSGNPRRFTPLLSHCVSGAPTELGAAFRGVSGPSFLPQENDYFIAKIQKGETCVLKGVTKKMRRD